MVQDTHPRLAELATTTQSPHPLVPSLATLSMVPYHGSDSDAEPRPLYHSLDLYTNTCPSCLVPTTNPFLITFRADLYLMTEH